MIRNLQEHLGNIQLQGGNNFLLEKLMSYSCQRLTRKFPSVWVRNSYFFKAHHPLLSDIDLTYVGTLHEARAIFKLTHKNKLLGELNFYPQKILNSLLKLANPYELKRDPLLFKRVKSRLFSDVQKEVYLHRHILGDIYWLQRNPTIRKKKWDYILAIAGFHMKEVNLSHLKELLFSPEPLNFYLNSRQDDLFNEFKNSSWRCYFPQKHIWEETDQAYLRGLSSFEKEFLTEQIKWEFWGIGTQLHWIDLEISYHFLQKLKKALFHIEADPEVLQDMDNVLNFIQEQLQASHKSF